MNSKPPFDPLTFFNGRVRSRGALRARNGAVTDSFTTEATGYELTSRPALILKETYSFASGRRDEISWDIPRTAQYGGTIADRVSGGLTTKTQGLEVLLRFKRSVPGPNGRPMNLAFKVRFSRMDDAHVLSVTDIRLFGILVGSMIAIYEKI